MADFDWSGLLSGLNNLYGAYRGSQTANDINSQVGTLLGNTNSAYSQQLQNLQQQIALGQAITQGQYNDAVGDVGRANSALEGNIGTLTNSLNSLSDPNSAYMQMARQAIERKDAAAGRRSQWGDREVQLAATLADYVGKYSPGLQNAITSAQQGISQNNLGLANIYDIMNRSPDRNNMALGNLLTGMNNSANTLNTTGRQAANSATNNTTGLLGSLFGNNGVGTQAVNWLGGLFGNSSSDWGTSGLFDWGSSNSNSILDGLGATTGYSYGSYGDPYSYYGE